MTLVVLGVRHHSPACAGWVERTIDRLRPGAVLVEGPADFTPRLPELLLDHQPPVALYSHHRQGPHTHGSWTPFCGYSPEWRALRAGQQTGAELAFIDLPAWHEAFADVENRYRDRVYDHAPRAPMPWAERLCEAFSADGYDAVWDHVFEQALDDEVRAERHQIYFRLLREANPAEARDERREAYMRAHVAHALARHDTVVVVCGGFHQPALEDATPSDTPPADIVPEEDAELGTYLVPYTFHRLDSFTGYQSGMPSPGYYQMVWDHGPERAVDEALARIVVRLRDKNQTCSTADLIAARTLAGGLARLRGHEAVQRVDLLDGLAASLVKGALDMPLPWTRRAPIAAHTDPLLVEILRVLSGDDRGRLHPDTPRPPLLHDVHAALRSWGVAFSADTVPVSLDLHQAAHRQQSAVLHRLRLLDIHGVVRAAGPATVHDVELQEHWNVRWTLETEASAIEAGAYGATIEDAARRRLSEMLEADAPLDALVEVLLMSRFAGLADIDARALAVLAQRMQHAKLDEVGPALSRLLAVHRHDARFGGQGDPQVAALLEALTDRALWHADMLSGATAGLTQSHLDLALGLRDVVRHGGVADATGAAVRATFRRRALDADCPCGLRGAAWGAHISLVDDDEDAPSRLPGDRRAMLQAAPPSQLGDFLAGLFCLARVEIGVDPSLVGAVHEVLCQLSQAEFLATLPALRHSFAYFPPREREALAAVVAALLGAEAPPDARDLLRPAASADELVEARALDRAVAVQGIDYGWWPEESTP